MATLEAIDIRGFWREGEVNALIVVAAKSFGHIREGGLC